MPTTLKQLECMQAANLRLTLMGDPLSQSMWQDEILLEAWTKASEEAIRTGLPVKVDLESASKRFHERAKNSNAT